jgi:hypothetical protein
MIFWGHLTTYSIEKPAQGPILDPNPSIKKPLAVGQLTNKLEGRVKYGYLYQSLGIPSKMHKGPTRSRKRIKRIL